MVAHHPEREQLKTDKWYEALTRGENLKQTSGITNQREKLKIDNW